MTVFVPQSPTATSMASSSHPLDLVTVTQYTTVYATDIPMMTDMSSPVSTSESTSAATGYLSASLSSSISGFHFPSTLTSSLPGSLLPVSSPTAIRPLPSVSTAPGTRKPESNDTFPTVILVLLILLAVLLLAMVAHMLHLRYKGQCPKCYSMRKQLKKWKSGELKCITSNMVREREMLNTAATEVDVEKGGAHEEEAEHAEAMESQATKKPSLWQKAKNIVLSNTRLVRSERRGSKANEDDRFFTVSEVGSNGGNSRPAMPVSSSSRQVYDDPYSNDWRVSRGSRVSASPMCSQPSHSQPTEATGPRVFADMSATDAPTLRPPLRRNQPECYTAYVTSDGDAGHAGSEQDQYQMIEWRKRGRKPPEPEGTWREV